MYHIMYLTVISQIIAKDFSNIISVDRSHYVCMLNQYHFVSIFPPFQICEPYSEYALINQQRNSDSKNQSVCHQ